MLSRTDRHIDIHDPETGERNRLVYDTGNPNAWVMARLYTTLDGETHVLGWGKLERRRRGGSREKYT
jgi:hypothetical protein